jgi:phage shock protein A
MAEMYEMMTGMVAPDLDDLLRASRQGRRAESRSHSRGHHGAPPPHAAPSRQPEPNRASARIKELYRLLVRKLHPDLNPDQPARDRELWHTVQEAYNNRDVEALEAAAARVEVALNGQAGKLSISILRRLVSDLKKALGALKAKFAQLRKHPAFDFAARSTASREKYEAKHRKQLERSLRGLQTYLADLTHELESLAARAAKPKAAKKRTPRQAEFF